MMSVTGNIKAMVSRLPKGYVFTYTDVIREASQKEAAIKALNRMVNSGKLGKIAKGKYYKPETSIFGELKPEQKQVVKDLLEENGKVTGYLTGFSMFNRFGLTTQVSNTIQIGKKEVRPRFKRERYQISVIKQKNTITKKNILLLQILDSIRLIKRIPDTPTEIACRRLTSIVKALPEEEKRNMVALAMKYPPATRALLGAILDELNETAISEPLIKTLNPITKFKLPGSEEALRTTEKWNIK